MAHDIGHRDHLVKVRRSAFGEAVTIKLEVDCKALGMRHRHHDVYARLGKAALVRLLVTDHKITKAEANRCVTDWAKGKHHGIR